jgi:hypothetical protein
MLRKIPKTTPQKRVIADLQAQKKWPTLLSHLTQTAYDVEGNEPRQTSTITLFSRDDGSLGITLNDRDNARACFASADSLLGLLDALERFASDEQTVWREDRQQTGGSKRKK